MKVTRNERVGRLRELVPTTNAILAFDLADEKQAVVLTDHDSRVLARRRVRAKAWRLGPVLDWGRRVARGHGFADVTVGCEPTGHRWRVLDRCNGHPERLARLGEARFTAAVRRELPRWGGQRIRRRIVRAVFAALTDPAGVRAQRPGALERAGFVLADWRATRARLAEVETRMVGVLDQLGLTTLVTGIPGVSAVGAAAMLAETGDPTRFDSPRAVVKHAGLCPRENSSGSSTGRSRISGRGRPGLRLAAWRAVWGALPSNPVMAARCRHLTTRADNPLTDGQARAALAAALLRWLHVIVTRRVPWDAAIAAGGDALPEAA